MAVTSAEVAFTPAGKSQLPTLTQAFRDLGFQVGPQGPASFSISAELEIFQRAFQSPSLSDSALPAELPVLLLPAHLRPLINKVVFTRGHVPFGS